MACESPISPRDESDSLGDSLGTKRKLTSATVMARPAFSHWLDRHPIANAPGTCTLPHLADGARAFVSHHSAWLDGHSAHVTVDIGATDAAMRHGDNHFSGAGYGLAALLHDNALFLDKDGSFHG
jgi:hypothetical protein